MPHTKNIPNNTQLLGILYLITFSVEPSKRQAAVRAKEKIEKAFAYVEEREDAEDLLVAALPKLTSSKMNRV